MEKRELIGVVHPLTLQPGGSTLKMVFSNGKSQVQPRIKYPNKYISKVQSEIANENYTLDEVYDITPGEESKLVWRRA